MKTVITTLKILSIFVAFFIVLTGPRILAIEGVHGIVIPIDGKEYYINGPEYGPNGERDLPGHYWTLTSDTTLVGDHYNTGPFTQMSWWATKSEDGKLLWTVEAFVDTWAKEKAIEYAEQGFVHYNELVEVINGDFHPDKILWQRRTAMDDFTFDGGPHPETNWRDVRKGIDYNFHPNGLTPYVVKDYVVVNSENIEPFTLSANYPNPFNPVTSISFSIAKSGNVGLEIYNISGQKIDVLTDGYLDAGHYTLNWDASNFTSGLYFYTLKTTDFSKTRKMLFMK
ncbi:T9SS type A sorting domain-containing protein [Candidatus Latescibacterota bacterium]